MCSPGSRGVRGWTHCLHATAIKLISPAGRLPVAAAQAPSSLSRHARFHLDFPAAVATPIRLTINDRSRSAADGSKCCHLAECAVWLSPRQCTTVIEGCGPCFLFPRTFTSLVDALQDASLIVFTLLAFYWLVTFMSMLFSKYSTSIAICSRSAIECRCCIMNAFQCAMRDRWAFMAGEHVRLFCQSSFLNPGLLSIT